MGRMKGITAVGPGDCLRSGCVPRLGRRDLLQVEELARLGTSQYRKVRRERDLIG